MSDPKDYHYGGTGVIGKYRDAHGKFLTWLRASDRTLVLAGHRLRNRPLTWLMRFITYSGSAPIWIVLAGGLYIQRHTGQSTEASDQVLLSLLPAFVAWGIGQLILRPLLRRPRPFVAIAEHEAIVWVPKNYSMPSTHAVSSFALFCSLWLFGNPIAAVIGVWSILVILSRLYLGVHYPSDLVAGSVLGLLSAVGFHLYLW